MNSAPNIVAWVLTKNQLFIIITIAIFLELLSTFFG